MSKAFIHYKELGSKAGSYRITLPGVAVILIVFASVLPYAITSNTKAFLILTTLALAGVAMGLLAGKSRLSADVDAQGLMYGFLAAGVVGISGIILHFTSLSITGLVLIYSAVAEELAFRFGAQRLAERVMGPSIALIFQAGLFMLYHWMVYPGYSLAAAYPLIAGLVFGTVNMVTKDLTPSLIAHVLVNALVAIFLG